VVHPIIPPPSTCQVSKAWQTQWFARPHTYNDNILPLLMRKHGCAFARVLQALCRTDERHLQPDGSPCRGQYVCTERRRGLGLGLGRAVMHA